MYSDEEIEKIASGKRAVTPIEKSLAQAYRDLRQAVRPVLRRILVGRGWEDKNGRNVDGMIDALREQMKEEVGRAGE